MSAKDNIPVKGGNQGEGDRESARRYNADVKEFVQTGKVDEAARRAGEQDPAEGKAAEEAGKARAKELDPAETQGSKKQD